MEVALTRATSLRYRGLVEEFEFDEENVENDVYLYEGMRVPFGNYSPQGFYTIPYLPLQTGYQWQLFYDEQRYYISFPWLEGWYWQNAYFFIAKLVLL